MNRALLCATVTARDVETLRARRDAAARMADLVEVRIDGLARPNVAAVLAGRRKPVVVTCRPQREGGGFGGSEIERRRILESAVDLGAEYVDVEWGSGLEQLIGRRPDCDIVLSTHDFSGVPEDLEERLDAMGRTGAGVVKAAVMVERLADLEFLARVGQRCARNGRVVLIGMGAAGVVTRLLPDRFGSCWSYGGDGVAPGQIDVDRMVGEFRFRDTTAATAVYGVAGRPVGHSLSPAMHNAAFAAARLDAVYVPLEARDAEDLRTFVEAFGVRGGSVTAPFKVAIMPWLRDLDPMARRVGAANTFRIEGSTWCGCNTDVEGFLAPLAGRLDLAGVRSAVLGAGGAARAVAVALALRGARVTVHARDRGRADQVAALAGGRVAPLPPDAGSWDLLINATPVGTVPHVDDTPVEPALLAGGGTVYDLVYNPERTRLLSDAEAAGCQTIGGLGMLVAQAEQQFEWWTAQRAPAGVMERAARSRLEAGAAAAAGRRS